MSDKERVERLSMINRCSFSSVTSIFRRSRLARRKGPLTGLPKAFIMTVTSRRTFFSGNFDFHSQRTMSAVASAERIVSTTVSASSC